LIKEFKKRVNKPVEVVIGAPIPEAELAPLRRDPKRMMAFLRQRTYELSPTPLKSFALGAELEEKYRN